MAIESARIVAGPTVSRERSTVHCLALFDDVPTPLKVVRRWDRQLLQWRAYVMPAVEAIGLIAVQPAGSEVAYLYVAVGSVWKLVSISPETIDPGTGKPWDPLARFYTPLAS